MSGQTTFKSVFRPVTKDINTVLAGTDLDFSGRATNLNFIANQTNTFTGLFKAEHLFDGQPVIISNKGTNDILIGADLMDNGVQYDIEPGTTAVLIFLATPQKFYDAGGSAFAQDIQENLDAAIVIANDRHTSFQNHTHNGTDTPRILATDLDDTGAQEGEYLKMHAGSLQWRNPFEGIQHDMISITSTDTTTNINQANWTEVPLGGSTDIPATGSNLTKIGNTIQVGFTGKIKATFNVEGTSSTQRDAPRCAIAVNGVVVPSTVDNMYIRNSSGTNRSSAGCSKTLSVTSGDIISVMSERGGASGTTTLMPGGAFLEVEIPASSMSQGPVGAAGYTGWDYLYGPSVPNAGVGSDGDVYLHTITGDFYKRESGSWNLMMNIIGPQGAPGDYGDMLWAEENGRLNDNNTQWSYGNGAVGNIGVAMVLDGQITGMSLSSETAGSSSTTVEILVNGSSISRSITLASGVASGHVVFGTPYSFSAGDVIGFRTVLGGGAYDSRVMANLLF